MTSAGCSQGLTVEVIDDMKVNRHLPPCTPGGPGTGESRSVGRVAPVNRCDYGPECLGKSFVAWCHTHAHRGPLYPTGNNRESCNQKDVFFSIFNTALDLPFKPINKPFIDLETINFISNM